MNNGIYCCTNENNSCEKREECMRYIHAKDSPIQATLFKSMCVKSNGYILFIQKEKEGE